MGSRLVDQLLERRLPVRVFCRDVDKARERFDGRAEIAQGDFADLDSIKNALTGADRIFLLTAAPAKPGAKLNHEHNVITAAQETGLARVVKLSLLGADEQAPTHLARVHRASEKELDASGLAYTILRPAAFMQGLPESVTDGSIYTCAEDGKVAMVDAHDIAAVAAAVLTEDGHEGKTYTLTGPEALSYDQAAATLSTATGQEIKHVRVSPTALIHALTGVGVPEWLAEDLAAQFQVFAAGHGAVTSDDVTAITGHEPRSLEAFAHEFAAV